MNCNIIGAGRLGLNVAYSLCRSGLISLNSICNTTSSSALQSCQKLGFGNPADSIASLPSVDVTWVCCNDDSIARVVSELMANPNLKQGSLIIHCSGVLSSSILAPLKAKGCYIGSFHPPKAFQSEILDEHVFDKLSCVVEGDEEVRHWLQTVFKQLGSQLLTITPEAKPLYHAAAVIASNYTVTLAYYCQQLMEQAGIKDSDSKPMIMQLLNSNIINMQNKLRIKDALTGPLMRGDVQTISAHLQAIQDNQSLELYKSMAVATLPMTGISSTQVDAILDLLNK